MEVMYIPKGRMCMACEHKRKDCSDLPFKDMPPLEKHETCVVVKCTKFIPIVPV